MAAKKSCALLAVAIVTCASLAVATHADALFTLGDTITFLEPTADSASLYLTREAFIRIRPLPPERLNLDGAALGFLPQRSYVVARVGQGTHCLTGIGERVDLCVEFNGGHSYFLRLREGIDENDRVVSEWLFESPENLQATLAKGHLRPSTLTEKGRAQLVKRAGVVAHDPGWEAEHRKTAAVAYPFSLDEIWYEDPLDRVNLKRDFQLSRTGILTVAADTIHYVSKRASVSIPCDQIIHVRFGGTRFTGTAPWVEIQYANETEQSTWSFADSRPSHAVETYDRIFAAAMALKDAHVGAAPDSSGASGNH
jgi:hypothetical protein